MVIATIATGRAPKPSFTAADFTQPSIGIEMHQNTTLRTQTFTVRGFDNHNEWREMRVTAPNADGARYIAHQRGIRVAECVQIETKI